MGWSPDSVETVGKRCVKSIVGALWYLDPHHKIYNDVIDLLASWNVGWSPDSVETVGKRCVKTIVGALWYLDPHHECFSARSFAIPASFHKFKVYNDWK